MSRPWTRDEIRVLKGGFSSIDTSSLARMMKRTEGDVEEKAASLALAKNKEVFAGLSMPRWSEAQVRELRRLYPHHSNVEIAQIVGRSAKAVMAKAGELRLKKSQRRLREMGKSNVEARWSSSEDR